MKKRIITSIALLALSSALAFASDPIDPTKTDGYGAIAVPFSKTSARMESMGGAGIAGFSNQDALYINPASLANEGLVINLPSLAFTLYDFKAVNATGVLDTADTDAERFNDANYQLEMGEKLLSVYASSKHNRIAALDTGLGFKIGGFAFAFDTKAGVLTYTPKGASSIMVIPTMDTVFSAGFGWRINKGSAFNVDIGAAVRLNFRGFWKAVEGQEVIAHMNDEGYLESLPENTPLMLGYAVPFDIGMNLNMPFGLTLALVAKNINGTFHMNAYDNYAAVSGIDEVLSANAFKFSTPFQLNMGFGWNPDLGDLSRFFAPSIVIDFIGIDKYFTDMTASRFFSSLKAGVEIEILSTFEFRAGYNSGYATFGLGFNLMNVLHFEAAYYRQEYGATLGDNPIDALTIRFNSIWEK